MGRYTKDLTDAAVVWKREHYGEVGLAARLPLLDLLMFRLAALVKSLYLPSEGRDRGSMDPDI